MPCRVKSHMLCYMIALITNDDGYEAPGIKVLAEVARELFDRVVVAAPRGQKSAVSQAITLNRGLRIYPEDEDGWAIEATPTDCVFFALRELMDEPPDFVLSGVNLGPNLGYDTLYSGTVAGAREGLMNGIPSLSFSLAATRPIPFEQAKPHIKRVLEFALATEWPEGVMLNTNIPSREMFCDPKGYKVCSLGRRVFDNKTATWTDPMGRDHAWIGGRNFAMEGGENSDCKCLKEGYVTLTPLTWDLSGDHNEQLLLMREKLTSLEG